jgi:hypothetical protein
MQTVASIPPNAWSIIGLVTNLVGVVLLFRFGIPYYVRTDGSISLILESKDADQARREKIADRIGWAGLGLVVLGTICQILGAWRA